MYSSHSCSDESSDEEEDRTTLRPKDQATGLARGYVRGWQDSHAFRELFQNAKDAIIETNNLDAEKFHLVPSGFDSKGVFEAEGRHPETGELLGFIRYDEKTGTLDLVNFRAQLPLSSLSMGYTTKHDQRHLAGGNGEGYKVAALIMLGKGYAVHISASSHYWRFHWGKKDNKHLYCNIRAPNRNVHRAQHNAYNAIVQNRAPREKKANLYGDVKFTIGVYRGEGRKISSEDIRRWMTTTLDLHPPALTIQSSMGKLILDPNYSNMVYLKGLLLERAPKSRKFKFGYDLIEGTVNRDRQWVRDPELVASNLATIWEEAIEQNEAATLAAYVNMHLDTIKWADVDLAEDHITQTLAQKIWQFLCEENSDKKLFYHDSCHGDSDVDIIRKSLRKKPKQLPESLWIPLQEYNLVRTPQEQQWHLLKTAPHSQRKETPYSVGVRRSLEAALKLHKSTQNLGLVFKSGATVDLDLLLVDKELLINDKYLDFKESHKNAPCWLSQQTVGQVNKFLCIHVVTHLYDSVLAELTRDSDTRAGKNLAIEPSLSLMVRESLQQMPLVVETALTEAACELKVSWSDSDHDLASVHGLDPKCRVILHRESTCSQKRFDHIEQNYKWNFSREMLLDHQIIAECGCPQRIISRKDSSVTFYQLDHREEYFPMVARIEAWALFGLPPKALRPSPPAADNPKTATRPSTFDLPARPPSSVTFLRENETYASGAINDDLHSLYDASDSAHAGRMDTPSYLSLSSVSSSASDTYCSASDASSSASNTLRAESPVNVPPIHGRSIGPTPRPTLGGQLSARLIIEDENIQLKEKVRVQHQQIKLLEEQLRTAKAELQARLELSTSQDREIAELRAEIEEVGAELQHTEEKLARIHEAARPAPEIERRIGAGPSGLKRGRMREERTSTGSSARASKRPKVRFENSDEMESANFGDEVMSEGDD